MISYIKIIWMLLLLELVAAGTVLHRRTEIDTNGNKRTSTWTTHDTDEDIPSSQNAANEGFQTYTRNGVTLRIKPQTTTLRIGGKNITPDQLLDQAKYTKDLDLTAVRQLLSTGHPVKRTNIENGQKHTSTYTLEPDGSILYRKVEDIDEADVERRFEEILKESLPQNPNKLGSDWEWAEVDKSNDEKNEDDAEDESDVLVSPVPKQKSPVESKPQQPNTQTYTTTTSTTPQPAKPQQHAKSHANVPTRQSPTNVERDFFNAPPSAIFGQYPKLPKSWNSDTWNNAPDPFNPPELPSFGGYNSEDFEYVPSGESTAPNTQTKTFTSTTTDKDGNTVQTSYTTGPNEWKRKTVKISNTNYQPTETAEESTTIQTRTMPSLEDFLQTQYKHNNKAGKPATTPATLSTSTTPSTIRTINVEDLPAVAVVNINKPIEEQFLHPLGPNTAGVKPQRTLKVENISPSPDVPADEFVKRTKIRTISKTLHSNGPPTAADLDPNMLDALQRAGIKPEEITNNNVQSITRKRIEPDGRIVQTTYRWRPINDARSFNLPAPRNFDALFGGNPFEIRSPYNIPTISRDTLHGNHNSASHFGIDFTPFAAAVPSVVEPKRDFDPKTIVRDREPLEDVDEEKEGATLNPLLIHPLNEAVPVPKEKATSDQLKPKRAKSVIAEFLAQLGLSVDDLVAHNGEFVKTIVDDDGRVLTAKFVLSGSVVPK
ncbi:uncharacterized protein [Eurosta solidaginis]|uniref:uncharacterized protein n=1 Tax=Eurosta solidaginis TaxID=178769 RepID=UPI00353169B5